MSPSADLDPATFGVEAGRYENPSGLCRPVAGEAWHVQATASLRLPIPMAVVWWAESILASESPVARARWDLPTRPQDWLLQSYLGVALDGIVGARTLAALDARLPKLADRRLWGSSIEAEGRVLTALAA